ncbi:MAG: hypothetical protein K2H82_05855 [Oscillospiraceae bacterium]|nr:hypothetical protein [Oscillospiraceae bacterium]
MLNLNLKLNPEFRKILAGLAVHCIFSCCAFGAVRVYQNGYNIMHHDQLRMASVSVEEDTTEIRILHKTWKFEKSEKIPDDGMIYYLVYLLTDQQLQGWAMLLDWLA